jgi:hypothetical protein
MRIKIFTKKMSKQLLLIYMVNKKKMIVKKIYLLISAISLYIITIYYWAKIKPSIYNIRIEKILINKFTKRD